MAPEIDREWVLEKDDQDGNGLGATAYEGH